MSEEDEKTELLPKRCDRCGNWLKICGHDLPLKERLKSVRPTYNGWAPTK